MRSAVDDPFHLRCVRGSVVVRLVLIHYIPDVENCDEVNPACSSCQPVDKHTLHHCHLVGMVKCRKDIQQDYHCTALF